MSIRPLPIALQKIAKEELNEVPEENDEKLNHIREWISEQPHLKCRTDTQWLLTFLRNCKFNEERMKEKLELYYSMRTLVPELFENRDPFLPIIQEMLSLGVFLPLSNKPGEPIIILERLEMCDPARIKIVNIMQILLMILDILMYEDDRIITGVYYCCDFKDFNKKYILQLTPSFLKKIITCIQNVYPIRIKKICLINAPTFFVKFFEIVKLFLTKKLRSRVCFCSLNKIKLVSSSVLPKEYGGEGESLAKITADWKLKVESYKEWFLNDSQYGMENLESLERKNLFDVVETDDSFKNLDID